ncbi:bifunctional molybdenum cofactor biosynthesis protein MoaC/MoaB [Rhodococcus kroppenstedtii]|nr:bifunctional molybdenum cofactor biosynthesis protein MoaC/MoaB [Rhodococcus kroppenstedtii]
MPVRLQRAHPRCRSDRRRSGGDRSHPQYRLGRALRRRARRRADAGGRRRHVRWGVHGRLRGRPRRPGTARWHLRPRGHAARGPAGLDRPGRHSRDQLPRQPGEHPGLVYGLRPARPARSRGPAGAARGGRDAGGRRALDTRKTSVPARSTHPRRHHHLRPRLAPGGVHGRRGRPGRRARGHHRHPGGRDCASVAPVNESGLSHVDSDGRARMVDVGAKRETTRVAVAAGVLRTTPEVVALVRADGLPKADVLSTARIAGIGGAKKTSELIPLCHPLPLTSVAISFDLAEDTIAIEATAGTTGRTGVEMEALTAVAVAGLTLHDMVKAVDPAAVLDGIRLLRKEGGKRGVWTREEPALPPAPLGDRTAVVVVASTAGAAGTREDTTGPRLVSWLTERTFDVRGPVVVADADIAAGLQDALDGGPALIVTTGGTGVSPTDATPEATRAILDRELPGVAEEIRRVGLGATVHASMSRGLVGVAGRTVVVNLPGSPGGVKDGLSVLDPILDHLIAQVRGGGAHE